MEDRRSVGASSCNCGDGTDQRVQSLMFMMMMMNMMMKNPLTPAGIEPATLRFVAQHLNHCATAVQEYVILLAFPQQKLIRERASVLCLCKFPVLLSTSLVLYNNFIEYQFGTIQQFSRRFTSRILKLWVAAKTWADKSLLSCRGPYCNGVRPSS